MAGPLTPGSKMMVMPMSPQDPATQITTFKSYVALIADPAPNIVERKLKAAQELSENFEMVMFLPQYPQFLSDAIRVFIRVLQDGETSFIAEDSKQQLRKLLLEIIHRIPINDHLKPFVPTILLLMFRLLEIENEENVLVCLRIIIELHKQFRPQFSPEVGQFLKFVKDIYRKLPHCMQKIFEQKPQLKVKDLADLDIEAQLEETFTLTTITTDKKNMENQALTYNLIPKADQSLKVLAELPIIVVLMYQLYKQNVHNDVAEFIPLIMDTITLQPTAPQNRSSANLNKETFVDFIAAQIKTLSFLAYIIRIYQESINVHSGQMVKGMLSLLTFCPQEVAHLRKELLIAARHILSTELRSKFVPCIEKLFDESVLIGNGWTTHESLRPLAYSTLADLVHHIRQSLSLADLALAVNLFSKNVHDESLPCSIQNMSCKLLLNLVECIRAKSEVENGNGRELFVRMLEVFVLKFKTIADTQIPWLLQKCKQMENAKPGSQPGGTSGGQSSSPTPQTSTTSAELSTGDAKGTASAADVKEECKTPGLSSFSSSAGLSLGVGPLVNLGLDKDNAKMPGKVGSFSNLTQNYSVMDCRGLVKTLVSGVKTITWGISSCKTSAMDITMVQNKQFLPKETLVYIRLLEYSLQALDIYTINVSAPNQSHTKSPAVQSVRTKEEKEVLEHLAGVYIMMSPITFKEIFSTTIEYMVDRIQHNYALQIVANSFLANVATSATFATILVEYLLKHMDEMGSNIERSNLYLKLFKLVFGSVSLLANENEQMLKPHLHTVVNRSMELARTVKEPYNYFLLLRALFRSIGGGSHDLLYQEFLPLLPNLLQGLNSLQGSLHKQHMKDLFVELCLTVPVRLSSLLPYLPMLMDPLVSALNGSQTLISQGLRTLELCVDNLQPDFLFNHIQPVRAELMQALWRCLHNPPDSTALVAYRVLGKFGGSNRKMLQEAQKLNYNERESIGPCVTVYFTECKTSISLPVESVVNAALSTLRNSTVDALRQEAWIVIQSHLVSSMSLEDDQQLLLQLFTHQTFTEKPVQMYQNSFYVSRDEHTRTVQIQAFIAMFVAASVKDLQSSIVPFMTSLICHYTMVSISQQAGPYPLTQERLIKNHGIDPHVLIDAIASVMGNEEKDLCVQGNLAITLMLKMSTMILGSKERACQLPMFEYLAEKMCSLCYERAWYTKLGGCMVIKFLYERMSLMWVLEHQFVFLKALLFVLMDMSGEVSNGALDMAQTHLVQMFSVCATPIEPNESNEELIAAQAKSVSEVVHELVRQVTSPNHIVREQVMAALTVLSKTMNKSITDIMEPHKDVLSEMVPPKKHLLRYQPANAQIGLMEGNSFCTMLEPRLFTVDLSMLEHKLFFTELQSLCEADDARLLRLPCYKNITNLVPLRKSAIKALSACHYIPEARANIFNILYTFLNSENTELQLAAHECMKKFISGFQVDTSMVHTAVRPLLSSTMTDFSNLTLSRIQVLSSLTQLFPNTFNEKLCEQLLAHLKKWLDAAVTQQRMGQVLITGQVLPNELKISAAIIEIFHLIPAASLKMIEPLISIVLKGEKDLCIEAGSPFRQSLMKFLLRYPDQTIELFLSDSKIQDQQWNRLLEWLLRQSDGKPFRNVLMSDPSKVLNLTSGQNPSKSTDFEYLAILIINILVISDESWLHQQRTVVDTLLAIWVSPEFHERHKKIDTVDYPLWQEPQLLIECLLSYFKKFPDEIELLFHMLRCFTARYIPQFQFFKEFLDETVAETYSVEWKRRVFFEFVSIFRNPSWSQKLKAKILQCVLIPSFASSFEKDEGEKLIGGPPMPDQENRDNMISVFINDVIDPENPFATSDAVRILLLQFSSLLVAQASPHIHDAANKRQGSKLRRLMTFAWPCLLTKTCVDPATKYHGHLLLSHIIAKFAIHKRIVLQVFHSLLKAHAVEARAVVKQALEILTPAMPGRMEDGNAMLTHWTKKIIVEEGHTVAQLVHILLLIVRHYKVYYPVRHHLIQHIVNSIQKLGLTPNATLDHRKLAVDLAEVIIKWEGQRIKEETEETPVQPGTSRTVTDVNKPIDKQYCDTVVNFLLRIACQTTETSGSPGDQLSRRCVGLLKKALSPEVWPNSDLKLAWFDKILMTVEGQQPNFTNICTALELLIFLFGILKNEMILSSIKPLQRSIAACMTCPNSRVIRMVHSLLARLMSIFPTEPATSPVASKHEELECLYACVSKVVYEGLTNYEKVAGGFPSQLFGTLMILKAACMYHSSYIDRLITSFMRVLQRIAREHLVPASPELCNIACELLILSLDLVKNRVGVMSPEMRKIFIGNVLVALIDKTTDAKVMRAILKMVEDWVKNKDQEPGTQPPSLREKAILLVKLMQHVEKRFPEDTELNAQFLDLVHYIFKEKSMANSELTSKLEPAFLAGLRCSQPQIREKFVKVFDNSIKPRLYDRLTYIITSQNWEAMLGHFWIKQCIELVLNISTPGHCMQSANPMMLLPAATKVISANEGQDRGAFALMTKLKEEPMDVLQAVGTSEEEAIDQELATYMSEESFNRDSSSSAIDRMSPMELQQNLRIRLQKQVAFLGECRQVKTATFLSSLIQLCHSNTQLAHDVWIQLLPLSWKLLNDRQQSVLGGELSPFLVSGSHVIQKDCHPSALQTFFEAVTACVPPVPIRPSIIKYLGRTHNLWHNALLILEQTAFDNGLGTQLFRGAQPPPATVAAAQYDMDQSNTTSYQQETLDSLCEMYQLLKEEDIFVGVWQKRARHSETAPSLAYEQHGLFEQSQRSLETGIARMRAEFNNGPMNPADIPEMRMWEDHWIRCNMQLNQWESLVEFSTAKGNANSHLLLESSWRVPTPNWGQMKEALTQVEMNSPREMGWKLNLYRGYLAICNPEDHHLNLIEKLVETSINQVIKEWRRLPLIVSQAHVVLLQAAQQIMELQEAAQINQSLQPPQLGREQSLHDMKAIIKTWRNRLPTISDELMHWGDIFCWRQLHYNMVVTQFEKHVTPEQNQVNHSMLGVHHSAMATVHYGKIARKHGLTNLCLDTLSKIHAIPSVPVVDCYQKIRQQVKCYLQMAGVMGKNELQEGLEVIESTNLKYFSKEMTSEFYALKGMFLAQIGRSEDANKAFSASVQMFDTLVKAWALWGDYLENLFTKERNMYCGVGAITCYLHACRHQNEGKSRKYLAKVLWLLSYDDDAQQLAEAVDKYCVGVPPAQWLPWIPQLLTCLVRNEGKLILNLLSKIGSMYPQAVYFPIRTLYLTLKIEQRYKSGTGEAITTATTSSSTASSLTSASVSSTPAAKSIPGLLTASATGSAAATGSAGSATSISSAVLPSSPSVNFMTADSNTGLVGPQLNLTEAASTSQAPQTPVTPATPGGAITPSAAGGGAPSLSVNIPADIGPIRATTPMWRCSRVMHIQRDLHPTILSTLEGIVDQMVWFRENWYEEVLRQLRQGLAKCYAVAFENRAAVTETAVTPHTLQFIRKLVSTFGVGVENVTSVNTTFSSTVNESLARRAQATAQDPIFQRMKTQFTTDFDFTVPGSTKLHNLINKLKKWIKILEARIKMMSRSFLIEEKCRFLSTFSINTAEIELPGEFLLPKSNHYYVRIERFMPRVDIVHKHNAAARRLYIRGHNGKIYPYLVMNDACMTESRREERVLQLLRMLNHFLGKQMQTSRRLLHFNVPRVVAVSPQMRLVEDNPASISLLDIYRQKSIKRTTDLDGPILRYYERLATVQARGSQPSHQVLRDILKEVQNNQVPRTLLKEWAQHCFPSATDYWTFRKNITCHLALWGFAEFILHLTRMNPDMMYLHQDSGFLHISYFKFDIDDQTGDLNANRPVPFRLTPNIAEFLTATGVTGPLTASMVAAARCFIYPQYKLPSFLSAILRDEYIMWFKKKQEEISPGSQAFDMEGDMLIQMVTKAVNAIMTRLQNLAMFDGAESRVSTLVAAANSPDNLCRMDPAWHPWL